jgi:hypothetical protein
VEVVSGVKYRLARIFGVQRSRAQRAVGADVREAKGEPVPRRDGGREDPEVEEDEEDGRKGEVAVVVR